MRYWVRQGRERKRAKEARENYRQPLEYIITSGECSAVYNECRRSCQMWTICSRFYPKERLKMTIVKREIAIAKYKEEYGEAELFEILL